MMRRDDAYEERRGRSRSRSPNRPPLRARSSSYSDFSSKSPEPRSIAPSNHKIFIDRLTRNVHEGHLREIFGVYGSIKNVRCNRQRGLANVEYEEGEEAVKRAIEGMDGGQIDGSVVRVSVYRGAPGRHEGKSNDYTKHADYYRHDSHHRHARHESHYRHRDRHYE